MGSTWGVSSKPDSASLNMFSRLAQPVARSFSTSSSNNVSVAVMGAAGGIGQPLSMLLKLNPAVSKLALYDIVATPGGAADLSHIETPGRVSGFVGADGLEASLAGAEIVVIPAGVQEAWHDQGRPLQHQRLHCCHLGWCRCQGLSRRYDCHHLQPSQLYCAHCCRGVQEGWRLQPQEDLWCLHPRCCPLQRVHWSPQGDQPAGGELPRCGRARRRHHHAPHLPVLPCRLL